MTTTTQYTPPEWAFTFHGHRCPFMPIGYRMGMLAMERLGAAREADHGFFVFPELGEGHPQTCMMDGIQVATGATYGKVMMAKTFYGKLAAMFYHPQHGAVRLALRPEFIDAMGKFEFFAYRKRGVEPSQIPAPVTDEVITWMEEQPDEVMFKIESKPDFRYAPVKGSFNKTKCSGCGEYVFDRYVRMKDGQSVCIPCSGYVS
jgi:formylmethanofuran dehydrogenase subunit E